MSQTFWNEIARSIPSTWDPRTVFYALDNGASYFNGRVEKQQPLEISAVCTGVDSRVYHLTAKLGPEREVQILSQGRGAHIRTVEIRPVLEFSFGLGI